MADKTPSQPLGSEAAYVEAVGAKASRKLKAQRDVTRVVWFGLGMSGLVGWSVAMPTLGGALLGLWIDHHHPGDHSWTLALLVAGLSVGCLNAWHWLSQQDKAMEDEPEVADE